MSFIDFLNEKKMPWPKEVAKKKATTADQKKGETYTVINTSQKEVLFDGLKRESAKEVVAHFDDDNIIYGSAGFISDKYLSTWN